MISFLLIISFLLHLITIYAIFILLKKVQNKNLEEVEVIRGLFEKYLQAIKAENNRLQVELKNNPTSNKELVGKNRMNENETDPYFAQPIKTKETEPIINVDHIDDTIESSLDARVLQLYDKGLGVTEIAKTLECGKTEVELIIELHKKGQK
ncbi:DUF6115 domain-containing protein [Oceanobacillus senegalensis]|uniref:DUF6115 domain-containing protein n=1 Tax=Oceanobacillus senegalensis TaxID=1936063 RepID=UPI000A3115EA|nr:hypothetical protein [Oceanobacillus senegalensis]